MPTNLMILALMWFTITSLRKIPICMIMVISVAVSYSSMRMEATMTTNTSTSAVILCSFTTPIMTLQI